MLSLTGRGSAGRKRGGIVGAVSMDGVVGDHALGDGPPSNPIAQQHSLGGSGYDASALPARYNPTSAGRRGVGKELAAAARAFARRR